MPKYRPQQDFKPRKPDFIIRAKNKNGTQKGEIGAAWLNEDGSLFLKFNPYVVVPVGDDFAIAAFPEGPARVVVAPAPTRDRFEGLDVPDEDPKKAAWGPTGYEEA